MPDWAGSGRRIGQDWAAGLGRRIGPDRAAGSGRRIGPDRAAGSGRRIGQNWAARLGRRIGPEGSHCVDRAGSGWIWLDRIGSDRIGSNCPPRMGTSPCAAALHARGLNSTQSQNLNPVAKALALRCSALPSTQAAGPSTRQPAKTRENPRKPAKTRENPRKPTKTRENPGRPRAQARGRFAPPARIAQETSPPTSGKQARTVRKSNANPASPGRESCKPGPRRLETFASARNFRQPFWAGRGAPKRATFLGRFVREAPGGLERAIFLGRFVREAPDISRAIRAGGARYFLGDSYGRRQAAWIGQGPSAPFEHTRARARAHNPGLPGKEPTRSQSGVYRESTGSRPGVYRDLGFRVQGLRAF